MEDEFFTLADLALILVANTAVSHVVGKIVDWVWHRGDEPDTSMERVADALESIAENVEQASLASLFKGRGDG